jgi:endonuclease/exonuclease/phosphatase family metal-dependent hydrolase
VIATLLAYLNVLIPPQKFFIFPVLGLFYPVLFFLNCFFIVFWLFQDVKWMVPSVICLILGWNQFTGFVGLNNSQLEGGKDDITVMTYNTGRFYDAYQKFEKNTPKKIASFFADEAHYDIICLQEYDDRYSEEIERRMVGYDLIKVGNKRTVILSKYPEIRHGEVNFGTRTNACVWADFLVDDDTIRVYSIHLLSTKISGEADQVLDNIDLQERSTWKGMFSILSKYGGSSIARKDQAEQIKEHMKNCKHPIILCGDFNEPPASFVYNYLCQDFQDSFREQAEGIASTYRGRIPFLRIDYILNSRQLEVIDYKTLEEVDFSDHIPVVSTFSLKRDQ